MTQPDTKWMRRAMALAVQGQGAVEPNPMVGCVVVRDDEAVGKGFHAEFGGPHAEVAALVSAGHAARGATMYVTLEPCCHTGKTPPCSNAIIDAGLARVVVAMHDPFPQVDGGGIAEIQRAGIDVDVGVCEVEARALNAPYLKLVEKGRPWIIAKWAMTLDGKIATRTGDSRWISNEESRAVVHALRGRVDAIMVGRQTAAADDPLLTARPPGSRVATRIVVDTEASLSPESQLVRTANEAPVLVATSSTSPHANRRQLEAAGCELLALEGTDHAERSEQLLDELGRRKMTNVLAEGGGRLLGSLWDAHEMDEVHVFIAPKIIGGAAAISPIAGAGFEMMPEHASLIDCETRMLRDDVYMSGRVAYGIP